MKDKNGKEITVGDRLHITGKVMASGGFVEIDRDITGVVECLVYGFVPCVVCKRMGGGIIPVFPPSVCEVTT